MEHQQNINPITPPPAPAAKTSLLNKLVLFLGALALLVLGGVGVFAIIKKNPQLLGVKTENMSEEQAKNELQNLIKEVGKIIELPLSETPTLATVTDLEKVKGQQFFANAMNGDKVLIYTNAQKAILYR